MTTPAAGWYHDPSDSGAWRWWDGATWTAHVRPKAETAPVAVVAAVALPVIAPAVQTFQPAPVAPPAYRASGGGHVSADYARLWVLRSPQTVGIWLLALLPIIAAGLLPVAGIVFQTLIDPDGPVDNPLGATQTAFAVAVGYAAFLVISAWIFAGSDIRTLKVRGYLPPTIWWMLLPPSPLSYFIARGKTVRLEGQRAWPPELLFFLSIIIPIAVVVVGMTFAMSVLAGLVGTLGIPL